MKIRDGFSAPSKKYSENFEKIFNKEIKVADGREEKRCRYCFKILGKENGELVHGCLDCHSQPYADRIDQLENEVDNMRKDQGMNPKYKDQNSGES